MLLADGAGIVIEQTTIGNVRNLADFESKFLAQFSEQKWPSERRVKNIQ